MIPSLGLVNRVYPLVKWASLPWNEEETKPSMSCKTSSTCRVAQLNVKLSLKIELPLMQVEEISKTLVWSTIRLIQNTWRDNPSSLIVLLREVVKKSDIVRSAPSALNVSNPFFHWNLILWYPRHIVSHREGSQKCIFMPFSWLQMIIRRNRPLGNDRLVVRWKLPFSCATSISEHICSLSGVKHTTKTR